jgi:cbb3-type cytochrome oxidase subunit 3
MGANGGPLAEAYNGAIFLMLGVLFGVFSAIGYFIFRMANRARAEGSM